MKIEIRKEIMLEMIDKLYCNGLFPDNVLKFNNNGFESVQFDKSGIFRRFLLPNEKFKIINKSKAIFKFKNRKLNNIISLLPKESYFTIDGPIKKIHEKKKVEHLDIKSKKSTTHFYLLNLKKDDMQSFEKLPYTKRSKFPYVKDPMESKTGIPLDTHIVMSNEVLKDILSYIKMHGPNLVRFIIKEKTRDLDVIAGDITKVEYYTTFENILCKVYKFSGNVDISFDNFKKILETLDHDASFYIRQNFPMIIFEIDSSLEFMVKPIGDWQ